MSRSRPNPAPVRPRRADVDLSIPCIPWVGRLDRHGYGKAERTVDGQVIRGCPPDGLCDDLRRRRSRGAAGGAMTLVVGGEGQRYGNYGCRCERCTKASSAAGKARAARARARIAS